MSASIDSETTTNTYHNRKHTRRKMLHKGPLQVSFESNSDYIERNTDEGCVSDSNKNHGAHTPKHQLVKNNHNRLRNGLDQISVLTNSTKSPATLKRPRTTKTPPPPVFTHNLHILHKHRANIQSYQPNSSTNTITHKFIRSQAKHNSQKHKKYPKLKPQTYNKPVDSQGYHTLTTASNTNVTTVNSSNRQSAQDLIANHGFENSKSSRTNIYDFTKDNANCTIDLLKQITVNNLPQECLLPGQLVNLNDDIIDTETGHHLDNQQNRNQETQLQLKYQAIKNKSPLHTNPLSPEESQHLQLIHDLNKHGDKISESRMTKEERIQYLQH